MEPFSLRYRNPMQKSEFSSADGRFGLLIPEDVLAELFERCAEAGCHETGSILVGHYRRRNALAVVTSIPETPGDSFHGRAYFERGTRGLRALLNRLWIRKKHYYLGEWHYHPNARPDPSGRDHDQMRQIASCPRYACPEPILVIVGGTADAWLVSARVYPGGSEVVLEATIN
jgi:integrative and conjugative element protein (TIGR02256 family)